MEERRIEVVAELMVGLLWMTQAGLLVSKNSIAIVVAGASLSACLPSDPVICIPYNLAPLSLPLGIVFVQVPPLPRALAGFAREELIDAPRSPHWKYA